MATPLIFSNPLKFGPDSYHNAKGRPTVLHREREHPKPHVNNTHIHQEGPSMGPAHTGAVARRVVEQRHGDDSLCVKYLPKNLNSCICPHTPTPQEFILVD